MENTAPVAARPRQLRSATTNGNRPFVLGGDGRGTWVRRWRDLTDLHVSDLGGPDLCSEAQLSLCRRGVFTQVPRFAALVDNMTADTIALKNRIDIQIRPARFRTIRGITAIAAIAEECSFWQSDDSRNPDKEILAAIRPAMATTALRANDDETNTCRELTLGGIGNIQWLCPKSKTARLLAAAGADKEDGPEARPSFQRRLLPSPEARRPSPHIHGARQVALPCGGRPRGYSTLP